MEYVDFNARRSSNVADQEECVLPARSMIPCCECGVLIQSNSRNMCISCLREEVDIAEGVPKQIELQHCRNCERYLVPPGDWINATLESRELLTLCLKKVKGLKEFELIDASFVWTEAHSKRIRVKLTVLGRAAEEAVLRQVFVVEYIVQNQMCDDCHRIEAKDYWRCVVQVRQHAVNKKTYLYLEQLILKHRAHEQTLGIKPVTDGLDFYYANENHARKMVNFLESMVPVKVTPSRRLISHDHNSNIYHYKYTWSVEIAPLSRDSLVCLSNKLRQRLGHLPHICLVYKITNGIHLIDPLTAQISELSSLNYFRAPFEAICNPHQLVEYVIMDLEAVGEKERKSFPGQGQLSARHTVCDVWLVRASQLGCHNHTVHTRTHLGHLLNVGDSVLGYSLSELNINEAEYEKLRVEQIPDVVLVRKCHADRQLRSKQRLWKLQHLTHETEDSVECNENEKLEFMEDLEEDEEYRNHVNIYRDAEKTIDEEAVSDGSNDMPRIALTEMLEDFVISADSKTKSNTKGS